MVGSLGRDMEVTTSDICTQTWTDQGSELCGVIPKGSVGPGAGVPQPPDCILWGR